MKFNQWSLTKTGLVAGLTGLAAVTTLVTRIPIPATTGYFNIGDVFVIFAGLWLGPVAGLIVGAVGPTFADLIGFPVFVPATLITKGLEGFVVGVIAGPTEGPSVARRMLAAAIGGIIIVVGYFIFEGIVYPKIGEFVPAFAITDIGAAAIEIIPNTAQALAGAIGGFALWRAVSSVGSTSLR